MTYDPRFPPYGAPMQRPPGAGPDADAGQQVPMGDRQAPWPPPASARPAQAPTIGDFATTGSPFARVPLTQVWTLLPQGANIAMFSATRVINVNVNAEGALAGNDRLSVRFDRPTACFQLTGTAVSTDPDNQITGDPRDTFLLQFQRSSGAERFFDAPALGSTVLGSGAFPFYIAPNGWLFNGGEELIPQITPLRGDLRIVITIGTAYIRGPGNFTWGSSIG